MAIGKRKKLITIIITCHSEGVIAYRGIHAWQRTRIYAREHGIDSELIAVLDRANDETFRAIIDHQPQLEINRVITTSYGDPGPARNDAISLVTTPYVAIADADDLPSLNWITEALRVHHKTKKIAVVHPEISVYFGTHRYWFRIPNQNSSECDVRQLIHHNFWSSTIITQTVFLQKHPYKSATVGSGWGHEDWEWNTRAIYHGATHLVAPGTVQLYRTKSTDSLSEEHDRFGELPRANAFFEQLDRFSLNSASIPHLYQVPPKRTQRWLRRIFKEPVQRIPSWVISEIQALTEYEPEIHPAQASSWPAKDNRAPSPWPAEKYIDLLKKWPADAGITHLFLLPWLQIGGADRMALAYITSVAQTPGNKVAVLLTQHTWQSLEQLLPKSVLCLAFDKKAAEMPMVWQIPLITRLIIQRTPRVVHIINSRVGWEALRWHGLTLTSCSTWYATLFCNDHLPSGESAGYAQDYLTHCWQFLNQVFTDSATYRHGLLTQFGIPEDSVTTHYALAANVITQPQLKHSNRLLWAGRLDYQKRPDILAKIARRLPMVQFDVFGSAVLNAAGRYDQPLRSLANVHLKGAFSDFTKLPHHLYAGFIYTSQWDGLPNVLLEATAAGLPIIAPDVGGISELITKPTGYLVDSFNNIDQYVSAIRHLLTHPEYALNKVRRAQKLIAERHSEHSWHEQLQAVSGYLQPDDL